jgi:hypothetical protein
LALVFPLLAAPALPAIAADPATTLDPTVVTGRRLDAARAAIEPRLGASTYTLPSRALENRSGTDNTPFNEIMLQTPGVSQEAFGQIHVRNEMANMQYRLNGIILPEGVSFFGQSLSPRYAGSIELITGALPAQYGLRTAGIIDITTKSGLYDNGGTVGVYVRTGGSGLPARQEVSAYLLAQGPRPRRGGQRLRAQGRRTRPANPRFHRQHSVRR